LKTIYFLVRAQAHNMVHVEVWLGDGSKTVGARWHKGCVQVRLEVFNSNSFRLKVQF